MRNNQTGVAQGTTAQSIEMLKAVIDGRTYAEVGSEFGVSRTAVERRVKRIAAQLSVEVGIEGLNEGGSAFVLRLRRTRDAILRALDGFEIRPVDPTRLTRFVSRDEVAQAAHRIRGRSAQPARDTALFYMLFATGARPLEVARLRLKDYLEPSGSVRRESELPVAAAIGGKARPLYFASRALDEALSLYLRERVDRHQGLGDPTAFRGLDPESQLFLTDMGAAFRITRYGEPQQHRFLCRPILETYRKLFRYAELRGVTALTVRHTVVARLYERGADEGQIGMLLGISERRAVRSLFPRARPTMDRLVDELI